VILYSDIALDRQ